MVTARGWTEQQIRRREQTFDGLVNKAVRMSLRALTADARVLTAAIAPQPLLSDVGVVAATWLGYVGNELYPYLVQTFVDSADATATAVEAATGTVVAPVTYSYAADYLKSASNRLVGLGDQVWNAIRDELAVGYDAGESIAQLATRVRHVSGVVEKRALTIARTEVASAVNQGSLYQLVSAGFTDLECRKCWLATEDERTRPFHVAADGQCVGLLQPFRVGGEGLQCPGDPTGRPDNVINCRCTLEYRFDDDDDDNEPLAAAAKKVVKKLSHDEELLKKVFTDTGHWNEKLHPRNPNTGEFINKGTAVAKVGKALKINTKVIYNTKYSHGQVIAVQTTPHGAKRELRWNENTKKFEVWSDWGAGGSLTISQALGKGMAYSTLKNETGWTTPPTAVTPSAPSLPTSLSGSKNINDYFDQLTADKWQALTQDERDHLLDLAAHEASWHKNYGPSGKIEDLSHEILDKQVQIAYPPSLGGELEPQNAQQAIDLINAMSGPEFNDWIDEHHDELVNIWSDLSKNEQNALLEKAAELQTNPTKKGYAHGDLSYLEPFYKLTTIKEDSEFTSTTNLPDFENMNYAQINDWFQALTLGEYKKLSSNDKADLDLVAMEAENEHGNAYPWEALQDIKEWFAASEPNAVAAKTSLLPNFDDMTDTEVDDWFQRLPTDVYDNFPQTTKDVLDQYVQQLSLDKGNFYPQDVIGNIKGALGILPPDELPNVQGIENLTSGDLQDWIDENVNTDVWNNLTDADKGKISGLAIKHNLSGQLSAAIGTTIISKPTTTPTPSITPPKTPGWPHANDIIYTGVTLGTHGAKVYEDKNGDRYLFKPTPQSLDFTVKADVAVSALQKKLGIVAPEIHEQTVDGDYGSLQRMVPGATYAIGGKYLTTQLQNKNLQKELLAHQAFDWLISQHDSHAENFIKDLDGNLIAVDKTQAFKFFPGDLLNSTYQPNEHPTVYKRMWQAFENGEVDIADPSLDEGIGYELNAMQNIPDQEYRDILRPYAEAAAKRGMLMQPNPPHSGPSSTSFPALAKPNDVENFLSYAVARKNSLVADFALFYQKELGLRAAKGHPAPSASTAVTSAPLKSTPTVTVPKNVGKPIKINTATVYKVKYADKQLVAERIGPNGNQQQIFWNATTKKFGFRQANNDNSMWHPTKWHSKDATYQVFKNDTDWKTPSSGALVDLSPVITPTTPTSPTSPVVAPKPPSPKTPKLTAKDIQAQYGVVPPGVYTEYFNSIKKTSPLGKITLSTTQPTVFKAVAHAVALHNLKTPDPAKQLNLLQGLKVLDEQSTPAGGTNTHLYEKKVVDWLQTAAGKKNAPSFVKWAQETAETPAPPIGTIVATPPTIKVLNPYEIGFPNPNATSFGTISVSNAASMHTKMRAQHGAWSLEQKKAIKNYTGSAASVNGSLRSGKPNTAAKMIQSAMAPAPQSFTVHRGTDGLGDFIKANKSTAELQTLIGQTVTDPAILSTSVGGTAAFGGRKFRLTIDVPDGTPVAYVRDISSFPNENELLLAAGLKYQVLNITHTGYVYDVHLKVVA